MDEMKSAEFWDTEKELKKNLLLVNAQLEVTQRVLIAQMPKLQELFLQFTQLGEEIGLDMESLGVKKLYDRIKNNELFQANDVFQDDISTEKNYDARQIE